MTRAKWLRTAAGHHTRLANKLINVVVAIKVFSIKTIAAYKELAGNLSKQEKLTQNQKDQIKESWTAKGNKQSGKGKETAAQEEVDLNIKIEEVQKLGNEAREAMDQIEACDINNTIHAAKIARYGEAHKQKAQSNLAKVKGKVEKGHQRAKLLLQVRRQTSSSCHKRTERQADGQHMQRSGHQRWREKGTDHQQPRRRRRYRPKSLASHS